MTLAPQDLATQFYNQYQPDLTNNEVIVLLQECLQPVLTALSYKLSINNSILASPEELESDMVLKLVELVNSERESYRNRLGELWRVIWRGVTNHAISIQRRVLADKRTANLKAQSFDDIEWLLSSVDASLEFQIDDFISALNDDEKFLVESVVYSDPRLLNLMEKFIATKTKNNPHSEFSRFAYPVLMEYTGWGKWKLAKVIRQTKESYLKYLYGDEIMNKIYVKTLSEAPTSVADQVKAAMTPEEEPKFVVPNEDKETFTLLVAAMLDGLRNGEYCVIGSVDNFLSVVMCTTNNDQKIESPKKDEPQPVSLPEPPKSVMKQTPTKLSLKQWEEKITTKEWRDFTQTTKSMSVEELLTYVMDTYQVVYPMPDEITQTTKAVLTRKLLKKLGIKKYKPEYNDGEAREKARYTGEGDNV